MSALSSSLRAELIRTKDDKEYRHAYADETLNATIATQIKVLREQRDLTQEALAQKAGMNQSMISRYENVNYSSWSINTLKKLAEAFDVFLEVRFRSFRALVESTENFSREALQVPAFTDDPFFSDVQPGAQPRVISGAGRATGTSLALGQAMRIQTSAVTEVGSSATLAAGGTRPVIRIERYATDPCNY